MANEYPEENYPIRLFFADHDTAQSVQTFCVMNRIDAIVTESFAYFKKTMDRRDVFDFITGRC